MAFMFENLNVYQKAINFTDQIVTLLGRQPRFEGPLARTATQLLAPKRIQGFDTTVMGAIFSCVPHFRGHVQEIIHMTRSQLGERYRFDFVPQGPEQESKH